jgi:hypothetical protein
MLNATGSAVPLSSGVSYRYSEGFDKVHYLCYTERPSAFDRLVKGEGTGVASGSGDLGPGQEAV